MPLIALGVLGAVGATVGAVGAAKAAKTQSNAAMSAADLQHQDAQAALAEQQKQSAQQQQNIQPFLDTGTQATTQLRDLIAPGGMPAWGGKFTAPTAEEASQTPGYQFQLEQGRKVLENSASARGTLLTGGTAKALERYGQGVAAGNYSDVYNRALQQYQQGYNEFQNNQANQFNRLSALSGGGQTAATNLNSSLQQGANNTGNILLQSGRDIGQNINNAGAATASGYIGGANAISGGLNNIGQSFLLSSLLKPDPSANPAWWA